MKFNRVIDNEEIEDFLDSKVSNGTSNTIENNLHEDIHWKGSDNSFSNKAHQKAINSLKYQYLRSE